MGPTVAVASPSRWRRVALAAFASAGLLVTAAVVNGRGDDHGPRRHHRSACGARPHHGHHPHRPPPPPRPAMSDADCRAATAAWADARRGRDLGDAPSVERDRVLDACLARR